MDRERVPLGCDAPAVLDSDPERYVRRGPYDLGYELPPGSTRPHDLDEIVVAGRPLILPSEEEEEEERRKKRAAVYAK